MKKVGIVTFYDHNNYGAMLQAYALSACIKSLGGDSQFVSFGTAPKQLPVAEKMPPMLKKIKIESNRRNTHFDAFREKWLPSAMFSENIADQYDCVITGSDQVWNREIIGSDDRFFLSFVPDEKKRAYAPSLGKANLTDEELQDLKEKAERFGDWISVREESASALLEGLLGREVPVYLDPTLLTKKEDWIPLMEQSEQEEKPYLLLIMVQNDQSLYAKAKEMAEKNGLALKLITASYFPVVGFEPWSGVPVEKYLSLVNNASYVVTSSFHGLAFSLIFERDFSFWPLRAELADRNTRMINLLEKLGLSDRVDDVMRPVNWEDVNEKRDQMRKDSLDYLEKMLEE